MARIGFKPYKLDNLTWWLNLRDNPSNINDNQAVEITNWNFEWTKLVSWRYNDPEIGELPRSFIRGMTLDMDDLWFSRDQIVSRRSLRDNYNM